MKTNNVKRILIVVICSIGLYFSGIYLIKIPGIKSLIDALNAMIFFICFFPFLIVTFALLSNIVKSLSKVLSAQ